MLANMFSGQILCVYAHRADIHKDHKRYGSTFLNGLTVTDLNTPAVT
ncbi:MAG: hypothetical protein ACI9IT_001159 [Glaciecola sp.]|jgi:hypothetical protein